MSDCMLEVAERVFYALRISGKNRIMLCELLGESIRGIK